MKRTILGLSILVCVLSPLSLLAQEPAAEAVMKLERAWLDAYENYDPAAMRDIMADDFIITFPDGTRQTKASTLEQVAKPQPGMKMKFRTVDVTARVYGDTVVLTGKILSEYTSGGQTSTDEMLYTDTYVRRDGRWQVVASHLGAVKKPEEQ